MNNIFVYGTLKRGFRNSYFLSGQEFLGEAETSADFRLFDGVHFPAMVEYPQNGVKVKGELWKVDDAHKRHIDRLEGVPAFYRRIPVTLDSHPDLDVETYVLPKAPSGWVDSGTSWPRKKRNERSNRFSVEMAQESD